MDSYSERGGAWIGRNFLLSLQGTWPFGAIRVTRDAIEVSVGVWPLVRRAVVPSAEVSVLRRRWGVVGRGLQIVASGPRVPRLVVFWSLFPDQLWSALRRFGYRVS